MQGPWEKYQKQATPQAGPWTKYATAAPAQPVEDLDAIRAAQAKKFPTMYESPEGLNPFKQDNRPLHVRAFDAVVSGPTKGGITTDEGGNVRKVQDTTEAADPFGMLGMASKTGGLVQAIKGLFGGQKASTLLREAAEKQYAQVLGPTKETTKHVAQKAVPKLLDQKVVSTSRQALQKRAEAAASAAADKLDEAWEKLPADAQLKTKPIVDALENAKKAYIEKITTQETKQVTSKIVDEFGKPFTREVTEDVTKNIESVPEAVRHLTQLQDIIKQYGDNVSPQSLRKVRQAWDSLVSRAGGYQGKSLSEVTKVDARREAANAIRHELGKEFPEIAKINSEFSFWHGIDDVLTQTIKRTQAQARPLGEQIIAGAGATGAVTGIGMGAGGGAALGAAGIYMLNKLVRSPGWKTVSAVAKSELARVLADGDQAKALQFIAKIGASSGVNFAPSGRGVR